MGIPRKERLKKKIINSPKYGRKTEYVIHKGRPYRIKTISDEVRYKISRALDDIY